MHCDLDLWPFDLKIYRAHHCLMGSLHVKFHDDRCKGKAVTRRKPKCGRQTDGRTDGHGDSSIPPPPNFVAGGIKIPNFSPYEQKIVHTNLVYWGFFFYKVLKLKQFSLLVGWLLLKTFTLSDISAIWCDKFNDFLPQGSNAISSKVSL